MEICGYDVDYKRKRIKNIILRVYPSGRISLSVPFSVSDEEAARFFASKLSWIEKKKKKTGDPVSINEFSDGEKIFFFGERIEIKRGGVATRVNDGILYIRKSENAAYETISFLSDELVSRARKYFSSFGERYGVKPSAVSVRKSVSRWGSCNPRTGRINLSFFLVSLPEFCLEYVVAHELCHLKYADHGRGFKKLLSEMFPAWKDVRKFMKENGDCMRLHF